MTIAEVIRVSRKARGWTQKALAKASGVPEPTIQYIEKVERVNPRLLTCFKIGRAFGTGLSLFDEIEELSMEEEPKN